MVICLEQGADLHLVQLMPMPLTVSCFSKIQIGSTFLVPAHLGSPGKRAVIWVCVCVYQWWVICLERGSNCLHVVQLMPLHPRTPSSLASFTSRLVLHFCYRLTQAVKHRGASEVMRVNFAE